jgi:hypothetical protein
MPELGSRPDMKKAVNRFLLDFPPDYVFLYIIFCFPGKALSVQ